MKEIKHIDFEDSTGTHRLEFTEGEEKMVGNWVAFETEARIVANNRVYIGLSKSFKYPGIYVRLTTDDEVQITD